MLRVTSRNVLVVPPLECAWLSFDDYLQGDASSCQGALLMFEVRGENDVTIILKAVPGAKRWQPLARQGSQQRPAAAVPAAAAAPAGQQAALSVESNYTVILGSHRNSCLKFEKNGETKQQVHGVGGAQVDPHAFTSYWINYQAGTITVGTGRPGPTTIAAQWVDPEGPIPNIQHIGLSCWDRHVSYKGVRLLRPLQLPQQGATQPACCSSACAPPSLFELASSGVIAGLQLDNVCGALAVAALLLPGTAAVYKACLGFAAERFRGVLASHGGALWGLSAEVLADLLQEPALVVPERLLFDVVALWACYGVPTSSGDAASASTPSSATVHTGSLSAGPSRQGSLSGCSRPAQEVEHVLQCVRFVLMSEAELEEVRHHPLSRRHPLVLQLIEQDQAAQASGDAEARSFCLGQQRRMIRPSDVGAGPATSRQRRYQRRLAPACAELMFVCAGDRNGVLWHIGTEYGRRQWVNPVLARRVDVRASSPASRYTDPKVIASRQFARTSFAGPRYDGGTPSSWWLLDLGPQHRLLVNYYTLRHDGSSDFARHWLLQGSNDLKSWVDLRRHVNDTSIRLPGQYGSWAVTGPAASLPYRAFRVLLTGPTLSATDPWNFCLSSMELYGYFYRHEGGADDADASAAAAFGVCSGGKEGSAVAALMIGVVRESGRGCCGGLGEGMDAVLGGGAVAVTGA